MRRDSTFARAAAVLVALMICLLAPMSAYAVQQKDKAETELPGENEYADVQYGALLLLNQWLDDRPAALCWAWLCPDDAIFRIRTCSCFRSA